MGCHCLYHRIQLQVRKDNPLFVLHLCCFFLIFISLVDSSDEHQSALLLIGGGGTHRQLKNNELSDLWLNDVEATAFARDLKHHQAHTDQFPNGFGENSQFPEVFRENAENSQFPEGFEENVENSQFPEGLGENAEIGQLGYYQDGDSASPSSVPTGDENTTVPSTLANNTNITSELISNGTILASLSPSISPIDQIEVNATNTVTDGTNETNTTYPSTLTNQTEANGMNNQTENNQTGIIGNGTNETNITSYNPITKVPSSPPSFLPTQSTNQSDEAGGDETSFPSPNPTNSNTDGGNNLSNTPSLSPSDNHPSPYPTNRPSSKPTKHPASHFKPVKHPTHNPVKHRTPHPHRTKSPSLLKDKNLSNELKDEEKHLEKVAKDPTAEIFAGVLAVMGIVGMLFTGWQVMENPDGVCASCCRLSIKCVVCIFKVFCLPCRFVCGRNSTQGYEEGSSDDARTLHHDLELT